MMSIAFTKAVVWKGRIKVSHSQCEKIAHPNAAVEAKNTSHQMPFCLFVFSIIFFAKLRSKKQFVKLLCPVFVTPNNWFSLFLIMCFVHTIAWLLIPCATPPIQYKIQDCVRSTATCCWELTCAWKRGSAECLFNVLPRYRNVAVKY